MVVLTLQLARALMLHRNPLFEMRGHDMIIMNEFKSLVYWLLRLIIMGSLLCVSVIAAVALGKHAWTKVQTLLQKTA